MLAHEGFGNMELVLDSFGVPTYEGGGEITKIARLRLREASDDILLAIARHYGIERETESASEPVAGENVRLPMAVCAAVAEVLHGSHQTLETLFLAAGAPGPPPELAHHSKWKTWLFRAGNDPKVDSLALLGNLIEEFMDLPPADSGYPFDDVFGPASDPGEIYKKQRERLVGVLEEHGFRYFRGGRVLPNDEGLAVGHMTPQVRVKETEPRKPREVEELLDTIIKGLPRAMHPLIHRRKGLRCLSFESEYDIQDLLHAQLRPWIADIRPEEFTPSYAGSSTRMDFLLRAHNIVIEIKRIRDKQHAGKVGDELIIDVDHYRAHPDCHSLWCVVYDPGRLLVNPSTLNDLEGHRKSPGGAVNVRIFVFSG